MHSYRGTTLPCRAHAYIHAVSSLPLPTLSYIDISAGRRKQEEKAGHCTRACTCAHVFLSIFLQLVDHGKVRGMREGPRLGSLRSLGGSGPPPRTTVRGRPPYPCRSTGGCKPRPPAGIPGTSASRRMGTCTTRYKNDRYRSDHQDAHNNTWTVEPGAREAP